MNSVTVRTGLFGEKAAERLGDVFSFYERNSLHRFEFESGFDSFTLFSADVFLEADNEVSLDLRARFPLSFSGKPPPPEKTVLEETANLIDFFLDPGKNTKIVVLGMADRPAALKPIWAAVRKEMERLADILRGSPGADAETADGRYDVVRTEAEIAARKERKKMKDEYLKKLEEVNAVRRKKLIEAEKRRGEKTAEIQKKRESARAAFDEAYAADKECEAEIERIEAEYYRLGDEILAERDAKLEELEKKIHAVFPEREGA